MSEIHPDALADRVTADPPSPWPCGLPTGAAIAAAALLLLLAVVIGMVLALHVTTQPSSATSTSTSTSAAPSFYDHLDGMQLFDQEGRAFRPSGLAGKIVLLNFVFTGCAATCPTQTRELAALQQALPAPVRRDVRFLSISVDPLGDTPALLHAYGQSAGADFSSWTFVTGRPQDIERLGERLGLFRAGAAPGRPEDHAASLWLVGGTGRLMQRYGGAGLDIARLTSELSRLRDLAAVSR